MISPEIVAGAMVVGTVWVEIGPVAQAAVAIESAIEAYLQEGIQVLEAGHLAEVPAA